MQLRELTVVKRSGKREPFDRDKLARSIAIATRKRCVDEEVIERMISGIVRQLEASGESEVTAAEIGDRVMEALKADRRRRVCALRVGLSQFLRGA